MPVPLFTQTVIAFLWDFDRTLIPGNQQEPLFDAYGVDGAEFWSEVDGLVDHYARRGVLVSRDGAYLLHILSYVESGVFEGLTNDRLRELGALIVPAPGIPEFLEATRARVAEKQAYAAEGITVEHYVVSTGIKPMIEGSVIAPHLDGIWANSYIEQLAPPGYQDHLDVDPDHHPISHLGYMIDNTAKTRAIFEINKGVNKNPTIDVNARMGQEQRRVPIRNMIYIADGPSDVPCFSIVNERGGKTLGVYTTEPRSNFRGVRELQEQGRIQGMAEADFREGEAAYLWLMDSLDQIADGILTDRGRAFADIPRPPGHV
ncbi:MAG TPA: HAD family hydrolase [Acidimicrobiia bacterium]|nr:HAD family hydrolase [Acidimicrobiia bacterium]